MTENDIKELLSKNFVRTIANRYGYKIGSIELDHGVDLSVIEVAKRTTNEGSVRYFDSGKSVELQLKSTTESSVTYLGDSIKYALKAKNYNDLIFRRNEVLPLFLILFILPDDANSWVVCEETMLKIEKHAYWYIPEQTDGQTENTGTITIEVPKSNLLNESALKEIFRIAYN
jgi:uncharacterized protein DUF4365